MPTTRRLALALALTLGACTEVLGPVEGTLVARLDGATCPSAPITVDIFVNGERRATQTLTAGVGGAPIAAPVGTQVVSARIVGTTVAWAPLSATIREHGTYTYVLSCAFFPLVGFAP